MKVHIVGGGLAGCEAAWQCLEAGAQVHLYEMRPKTMTAAHQTGDLCELVCSNSFKSTSLDSASGRLKEEMATLNSAVVQSARRAAVPAGQALAVDRSALSHNISELLNSNPKFQRIDAEISAIPTASQLLAEDACMIIATGPLTSPTLTEALKTLVGDERLYFYDAIAPILAAESIDQEICFRADRWGKGTGDYWNIPLDKHQYYAFVDAVIDSEKMPLHAFEEAQYFESCLPIEVMAERGRDTLRFGPMKPVGIIDPRTGKRPYAVVQLRQENLQETMISMVGFQTKMKWPEQKRVFQMLPGLSNAEFYRYGSVHRNTYLESPKILNPDLSLKANARVFLAGQITGVEGYLESAAIGLCAGRAVAAKLHGRAFVTPPEGCVMGALLKYVTAGGLGKFSPMNANLGMLPKADVRGTKLERKKAQIDSAAQAFDSYFKVLGSTASVAADSRAELTSPSN